MFKVNQNMLQAVASFNKLSADRAQVLLTRIFSSPTTNYHELFTEKERGQLVKQLGLLESDIKNIIKAFSFLLLTAIAQRNYPVIEQTLRECGLKQELVQAFNTAWGNYGNDYTIKIRDQPVAITSELKDFNWMLTALIDSTQLPIRNLVSVQGNEENLESNEDIYSFDAQNPSAIFNFQLNNSENHTQKVSMKFNKYQLQCLFEQLEVIQDQLDYIS